MAYTPVSQRGSLPKSGYVSVAKRVKTPTTTPVVKQTPLAPRQSMDFKVGAGLPDTLTTDEILNAQRLGVLPAGPLRADGLDATKVRKGIASKGIAPKGSSAFGRTDTFGAKALDLVTIPVRWTAGSLATLMVKSGLEKTNSSLVYEPKSRAEELLIGPETVKKLSEEGFSYGFKTTKKIAEKLGLPPSIANNAAWLSTLVLGGFIENPLLLGTGGAAKGALIALSKSVEKEIGRKLTVEEVGALAKDFSTISKITGKDERLLAVNDILSKFKKDVKPAVEPLTQQTIPKGISKELEPLAVEARKYGSVEEFKAALAKQLDETGNNPLTGGDILYHVTDSSTIDLVKISEKTPLNLSGQVGNRSGNVFAIDTTKLPKGTIQPSRSGMFKMITSRIPEDAIMPLGKRTVNEPFDTATAFYNLSRQPQVKPPSPLYDEAIKATPRIDQELFTKLDEALKGAKISRKEQDALLKEGRSQRVAKLTAAQKIPGEAGFIAQKGALKGEFEKADFATLRGKISDEDIQKLFDIVRNSDLLAPGFEKFNAQVGLSKLFGQVGKIPIESELALLRRVFPENIISGLLDKMSLWFRAKNIGLELANIPRSIQSTLDFSGVFRQGAFMIGRKQFWTSIPDMFRAFVSEKKFTEVYDYINKLPHKELMDEYGLAVTDIGKELASREERFASNYAETITGGKRFSPVRASTRAYTAFLNKLRADIFEDLINKAAKLGLEPETNPKLLSSLVDFINNGTGRGKLPKSMAGSAQALNAIFFSPRLLFSRLHLLNPVSYVKMDPFVRKEALKSLFAFTGAILAVLGVAKMGGADVETDSRSSDFSKIKIGNTRVDIAAGFQQYIRAASQLIAGETKSTTSGEITKLGEKYGSATRFDVLLRFFENKEAPIFSFVTSLLKGKDFTGQTVDVKKEAISRFVPMLIQDVYDIAQDDPSLLPLGIPAMFGVGLQTYLQTNPKKTLPQIPKLPSLPKLPKLPKLP